MPSPVPYAGAVGRAWSCSHGRAGQADGRLRRSVRCLPPSRRSRAAAARERPRPWVHDTVHPWRYGARALRAAPGRQVRSDVIHGPRALAPRGVRPWPAGRACQGAPASARGLRRVQPWHTRSGQGRAVRGGSPRAGVSIGLAASRTGPGSGCPLRPRSRWRGRGGSPERARPVGTCWTASRRRGGPPGRLRRAPRRGG